MPYTLSLLDKSPIAPGQSAAEAVQATLRFAQRAEELDYHRFWVAEHHNVAELASSAPEILVAHLLSRTSRIRIGSGGVMLQHYSPYKVAEVFHLLSAIAPDRVDLGVGKAPGGLPLSTRALQWHLAEKPDFNAQFALLDDFLKQSLDKIHPLHGVRAEPVPEKGPQPFLLGASVDSARAAARRDWAFVYAGHLNADPAVLEATLSAYRTESGGRSPLLALAALAADSEEQAAKAVEGIKIFKVHLENGQSVSVGSPASTQRSPLAPTRMPASSSPATSGTRQDRRADSAGPASPTSTRSARVANVMRSL